MTAGRSRPDRPAFLCQSPYGAMDLPVPRIEYHTAACKSAGQRKTLARYGMSS